MTTSEKLNPSSKPIEASEAGAAKPTARAAERGQAKASPRAKVEAVVDPRVVMLTAWRDEVEASHASGAIDADAHALRVSAIEAAVKRLGAKPSTRKPMPKADPLVVAKFFESTGLSRKELAAAVGVSTSVIATVQKLSGDRWSQARYEAAKPLIIAYKKAHPKAKA